MDLKGEIVVYIDGRCLRKKFNLKIPRTEHIYLKRKFNSL